MLPYIPIPVLVVVLAAIATIILVAVATVRDSARRISEAAPYPPSQARFRVLIEDHPSEPERRWEWAIVDGDGRDDHPYAWGTAWSAEDAQRRAFDSFSRWAQRRPDPSLYALAFPDGTVERV